MTNVEYYAGYDSKQKAVEVQIQSKMNINHRRKLDSRAIRIILIFSYGLGFSGFLLLLLAIHVAGFGHESRTVTVPYRVGFLVLSILLISYGAIKNIFARIGRLWIPLLAFWLLYFLRIALDGYLSPVPLIQPAIEYFQKAAGVTFIPMFLFMTRRDEKDNRVGFRAFWLVHICCLAISVLFYNKFFDESYRLLRYQGVDSGYLLSPILLSYIGVIAAAISYQLLISKRYFKSATYVIFLFTIIIGGIILMLYGGTRSALIVLIIVCLIISTRNLSRPNRKSAVLATILILIVGAALYPVIEKTGSSTIIRLVLLREQLEAGDPQAGGSRLEIYQSTMRQFAKSPLLGSSLEVKELAAYAHNHVLEAFMATGIFGGTSFLLLIVITISRSLLILKHHYQYGWIACLFLVYFLRGFFSTSIIEPGLWYSMLAVLSLNIETFRKNRFNYRAFMKNNVDGK